MPKHKLTDLFIRKLDTPEKRTEIYDTSRGSEGLALRLTPAGTKSFVFRYRFGVVKRYTIGRYPAVSLAKAREEVKELSYQVSKGVDPNVEKKKRKETRSVLQFQDLASKYKSIHLPSLRETTSQEHTRIIDSELVPVLGKMDLDQIDKSQILSLLDSKAIKQGKKTMANRIRTRLHSIFEFGIQRGLVDKNPVSGIKPFPEGEKQRERYYSDKEIKLLWSAFDEQDEPSRSLMKMLLLTGQRKSETMKMRWIDINGDIWTIPKNVAKGKRSHDVPLSDMAMDILKEIKASPDKGRYVFASPVLNDAPISDIKRSVKKVRRFSTKEDEKFKVSDFRLHDLRRTFATNLAKLSVDRTVLGKILNHKGLAGGSRITAIYDRHEYLTEKRAAMQKWNDHLNEILSRE
ncbi:MAG: tyrosine-type recombinase/integrase [Balneolaceae bacterium]|nr:tyrosine-type recombinase/integrase [Balneolaceae bacterium]